MVPPRLIRRLVLAPLVIVIALGFIVLSPFLALAALVSGLLARPKAGRMRSLRLVGFALVWLGRGCGGAPPRGAVPEPALRGHALVPGHHVPGRRADVRPAGRGGRARSHRRRAGRPADPAGDRAEQARRAGRLVPPGAPVAQPLPPAAAG